MVHRQNNIYDDLPTFYQQIPPPRDGGIIISVHVALSYADIVLTIIARRSLDIRDRHVIQRLRLIKIINHVVSAINIFC